MFVMPGGKISVAGVSAVPEYETFSMVDLTSSVKKRQH
jgi:hypothetical protein